MTPSSSVGNIFVNYMTDAHLSEEMQVIYCYLQYGNFFYCYICHMSCWLTLCYKIYLKLLTMEASGKGSTSTSKYTCIIMEHAL